MGLGWERRRAGRRTSREEGCFAQHDGGWEGNGNRKRQRRSAGLGGVLILLKWGAAVLRPYKGKKEGGCAGGRVVGGLRHCGGR